MRVRDIMTRSLITAAPSTSVVDARELMASRRVRHLLVVDGDVLVGIVTDRDIKLNLPSPATSLSVWELNYLLPRLTVGDVMTSSLITVDRDHDAREAAQIMVTHKIGALPVVDGGRLVGIVTDTDFLRAFVSGVADVVDAIAGV
jgi:acetoin utilization protein AcuB